MVRESDAFHLGYAMSALGELILAAEEVLEHPHSVTDRLRLERQIKSVNEWLAERKKESNDV